MDQMQKFSPQKHIKLSANSGGGFGSSSMPGFSLADLVRDTLISSLDARRAAQFPSVEDIDKAIGLLAPTDMVANFEISRISDILSSAMKAVRKNAKLCGESVPNATAALDTACRAVSSGLIDDTPIEGEPNASKLDRLKHLCVEDASLVERIATFAPKPSESSKEVEVGTSETVHTSQPQPHTINFALSTRVDRLALLDSPDPMAQAGTSARINALIEAKKVTEDQLGEFEFFASGTGKVDQGGALIVNKNAPLYTSLNTILSLLEDNVSPQMVMLTIQLKRLLESTEVELPDLIDEDKLQSMSESEFGKYLVSRLNLSLETVEAFCNEFGFDIEELVGSEDRDFDPSAATEALEEVAEGILFAMQNCSGRTIDQRVEALIDLSRDHPDLRGNLERVKDLCNY
jgi:hypothetical protein